jgi:hypothetical protein
MHDDFRKGAASVGCHGSLPTQIMHVSGKERPVIDRNSSSDHGQIMSPWTGPKA